eukprot:gene5655-biopygen445
MAATRLSQFMERTGMLRPEQAGFRKLRTTEEQTVALSTTINAGFAKDLMTLACFADHEGAFDKAWHTGILLKLARKEAPRSLIIWYRNFLRARTARVRWGTKESTERTFEAGVPQGTCSGPMLFQVLVSDFHAADLQFADDTCMWGQGATVAECEQKLNGKLKAAEVWVTRWRLPYNLSKCYQCLFTKAARPQPQHCASLKYNDIAVAGLTLRGAEILRVNAGTEAHKRGFRRGMRIEEIDGKSVLEEEGAALLRALCQTAALPSIVRRTTRLRSDVPAIRTGAAGGVPEEAPDPPLYVQHIMGLLPKTVRNTYVAYIRSYIEYASPAWRPYISTKLADQLDVQQNHVARHLTGCVSRTRIVVLLTEAGLRPLALRAEELIAKARERFRRLPAECPSYKAAGDMRTTDRSERIYNMSELRGLPVTPFPLPGSLPSWQQDAAVSFCPELLTEVRRTDPDHERRAATKEALRARGPFDLQIWTDGSCRQSSEDGGAGGIIIHSKTGTRIKFAVPTGKRTSSYMSEMTAINHALAALPQHILRHHCGLHYNDIADRLAAMGSAAPQESVPIEYSAAKAAIHRATEVIWKEEVDKGMQSSIWEKTGGQHWYRRIITNAKGQLRMNTYQSIERAALGRRVERIVSQFRTRYTPLCNDYVSLDLLKGSASTISKELRSRRSRPTPCRLPQRARQAVRVSTWVSWTLEMTRRAPARKEVPRQRQHHLLGHGERLQQRLRHRHLPPHPEPRRRVREAPQPPRRDRVEEAPQQRQHRRPPDELQRRPAPQAPQQPRQGLPREGGRQQRQGPAAHPSERDPPALDDAAKRRCLPR